MSRIFDKNTHRRYLTTLLAGIAKSAPEKVAFKGGTCAALFYGLPRFSFDLDFDILGPLDKRESGAIDEVLKSHGKVLEAADKKYTLFYFLITGRGIPILRWNSINAFGKITAIETNGLWACRWLFRMSRH